MVYPAMAIPCKAASRTLVRSRRKTGEYVLGVLLPWTQEIKLVYGMDRIAMHPTCPKLMKIGPHGFRSIAWTLAWACDYRRDSDAELGG
jgi:hypothetical protein